MPEVGKRSSDRLAANFLVGRAVGEAATVRRAFGSGSSPAALPLPFTPPSRFRGNAADIAGTASGISDKERSDAKLWASSEASCEFGEMFVAILESAVAGAAESELEMDTPAIGLTFAAQT